MEIEFHANALLGKQTQKKITTTTTIIMWLATKINTIKTRYESGN